MRRDVLLKILLRQLMELRRKGPDGRTREQTAQAEDLAMTYMDISREDDQRAARRQQLLERTFDRLGGPALIPIWNVVRDTASVGWNALIVAWNLARLTVEDALAARRTGRKDTSEDDW